MNYVQYSAVVAVLFCCHTTAQQDDDPIRIKLDKALARYDVEFEKYSLAVVASFEKRSETARKKGDKQLVDQIKLEQQAFNEKGEPPQSLSRSISSQLSKAKSSLQSAYGTAIREYTMAGKDELASAVQRELDSFLGGKVLPKDAVRLNGKAHKAFSAQLTWHEAKAECERLGGRLVVVESESHNAFLTGLAVDAKLSAAWLGVTDEKSEGRWLSLTADTLKYENWEGGQPNNAQGIEHYATLLVARRGLWWDYPANPKAYPKLTNFGLPGFICQWETFNR